MDRTQVGSHGAGAAHHVARGLRRECEPVQNQRRMAEERIVLGWVLRPKFASALSLTVKRSNFRPRCVKKSQEHKKVGSLKSMTL